MMKRWLLIVAQLLALGALVTILVGDFTDLMEEPYHHIVRSVIIFFLIVIGARFGLAFLKLIYRRRYPDRDPKKDNLISGLQNVYYLLLGFAILLLMLQFFGVDPQTLFTSLSIVAAAVAIVTKDFLGEILSGILMSFSNYIRIDDYVRVDDMKVTVIELGLQKTTLLTDDDTIITMPNSRVYNSDIINYTLSNQRRMSIEFQMALVNIESVDKLESDIIENLAEFHKYIEKGSFSLKVATIATDHLDLKFLYTLKSLDQEVTREIRKKVARRLVDFIKQSVGDPSKVVFKGESALAE